MPDHMDKLRVTLIGSFRKDPKKLRSMFLDLKDKYELLSPASIDFESVEEGFVRTAEESTKSITSIEGQHLRALQSSDIVFLHAPNGYIGLSAATEVGFAYALGIPIIADEPPEDATIRTFVSGYIRTDDSKLVSTHPGKGITGLQRYYERISERRGWDKESPRDILLLMTEELGELARAIRKSEGLKRDGTYDRKTVAEELADLQLYLIHLSSALDIELQDAVDEKESLNESRFNLRK